MTRSRASAMAKRCKDCAAANITTERPTPHPGPRCVTHHRAEKKRRQHRAHDQRTRVLYGLTPDDYRALYDAQGRRCFICQTSTGAVRRLAVDHDHRRGCGHPPERGCPLCVRALLCKRCNQLVAWWGVDALQRAIQVLVDPPAQKVLNP